ncbi:MAG: 1-deoxy-D-xylulose-5-phosphate reductoisomerase [Gemmatimonadaceae bacterium]|jgi:1-deoxy-D-xylulose-5-phosphate reductoisomerase|nr:1-deoxy-D-xylulose-5-phosphate reductoisomerase [Gemmatimonadaceae bacterium]
MAPLGVAVLGSTGSIGTATLRVIARHRERFQPVALTAFSNAALLADQVREWRPAYVGLVDAPAGREAWRGGADCLEEAATHPEAQIVLNAVVGAAGLRSTLAALAAGKRVALANKESLVVGGALVAEAARRGGGELVPVDSEHSAILQCLASSGGRPVKRLVITASGGPFRTWPTERLDAVTVADALQHPTWRMGRKITIDSATLANKALEVIEAHHLFGVPFDQIEVVVHPQSIVHSFVEFADGSVLAQLGVPSMELPILYALSHPERLDDGGVTRYDPVATGPLQFEAVRHDAFPALALGIAAGRAGGSAPAVFNAANEEAVAAFLDGGLGFTAIPEAIGEALDTCSDLPGISLDDLLIADAAARRCVRERVTAARGA